MYRACIETCTAVAPPVDEKGPSDDSSNDTHEEAAANPWHEHEPPVPPSPVQGDQQEPPTGAHTRLLREQAHSSAAVFTLTLPSRTSIVAICLLVLITVVALTQRL